MQTLTRRSLLSSAVIGGGALAVAGCATTTSPTGVVTYTLDPSIVDFIQSAVAAAAQYIPTVESIAATAASLFGPGFAAVVSAGSAAVNAVVAVLTNVASTLTVRAQEHLRLRLRASSPSAPVVIGKTANGVIVTGFHV